MKNCKNINYGNNGNVTGDVKNETGKIVCGDVGGDVKTEMGNVKCWDVSGKVKTEMGSIKIVKKSD